MQIELRIIDSTESTEISFHISVSRLKTMALKLSLVELLIYKDNQLATFKSKLKSNSV